MLRGGAADGAIKDGLMSDDRDHTIATATAMVMYARAGRWPGWMSRRKRLAGTKSQGSGTQRVSGWPRRRCAPAGPARLKILCRPAMPTPGHPMPGAVVGVAGKRE